MAEELDPSARKIAALEEQILALQKQLADMKGSDAETLRELRDEIKALKDAKAEAEADPEGDDDGNYLLDF